MEAQRPSQQVQNLKVGIIRLGRLGEIIQAVELGWNESEGCTKPRGQWRRL